MSKLKLLSLSVLSGSLFFAAWPVIGFAPIIFVAFVPLLYIENYFYSNFSEVKKLAVFNYSYLTFFIWNITTTWWIYNASGGGAAMAIICNSFLMAVVFMIYHIVRKKIKSKFSFWYFPSFWIAFEFIHLRWDTTWPWLTLGNVFSEYFKWIQWYEYTGVFGGSLWVFAVNILVLEMILQYNKDLKGVIIKPLSYVLIVIFIPIVISLIIFNTYQIKGTKLNTVIVQPNIDPYNEKFTLMGEADQLSKTLQLASVYVDANTDLLITPETTLPRNADENRLDEEESYQTLRKYIGNNKRLNILMGVSTISFYADNGKEPSATSRKTSEGYYYDLYNTAMLMNAGKNIQLYHKSKLVPGVEKMPFPWLMKPLEKFTIELGGTSGSLGMQDERSVFTTYDGKYKVAPIICYESVYGEYVTEYVKNGAGLLAIVTNDGWWGNTPGYKQHISYARLRAIETRRDIVRSANTGISAVINQKGQFEQRTEYWVDDVLKAEVNYNIEQTIYTKVGDLIARIAIINCLILFGIMIYKKFKK